MVWNNNPKDVITEMQECMARGGKTRHGMTPHYVRKSGNQCVKCSKERSRVGRRHLRTPKAVSKANLREKHGKQYRMTIARQHKGGKCSTPNCPHNCPPHLLQFHHSIPSSKTMVVSQMVARGRTSDLIWAEVDKCELICPICHLLHHCGYEKGPNGESEYEFALKGLGYDPLPAAWEAYHREHCGAACVRRAARRHGRYKTPED